MVSYYTNCKVRESLANWTGGYISSLTSRTQIVSANGAMWQSCPVCIVVPQGSVLGLLLFLVLMEDIDRAVSESTLSSFAGDTNISKYIKTPHDIDQLQQEVNHISDWAKDYNTTFINERFELLRCGSNQNIIEKTDLLTSDNQETKACPHI